MKIAISFVGDVFETKGPLVRVKRILELFKNRYNVTLIMQTNEKKKLKSVEDVNTIIIRRGTKFCNLKLIRAIIKNKFCCIYCSNDWINFIVYYIFSKIYGYKIIFEAHMILSETSKRNKASLIKLRKIYEKFVIKHADHIIAVGMNMFEAYKGYNKNIDLIPLFVNTEIFKKNETSEYNVKKDFKTLGLIGPFIGSNKYSLEFLYQNLSMFDQKINFVIIGKCDNKIENRQITYTDYLDTIQNYVDQLRSLDAVLARKGIGDYGPLTKIIESMSCSLPVFTTPDCVQGIEYAMHEKNIFIFEEDELVDKVNELLFNEELMKEIGKNAGITVEKYYSKKVNEEKLIRILENLFRKQCK